MEFFFNYFLTFIIFSIVGYVCEVIYCSVGQRKLVNRGFMYGPWLPIYGCGGLIIEFLVLPLRKYPPLVFIFSFLDTSLIEYFASFVLEKIFSIKLWDYSKKKININGRVCLLNSTLFGVMGLALVYLADPLLQKLLSIIPINIKQILTFALSNLFVLDLTLSITKMASFKKAIMQLKIKIDENEERIKSLYYYAKDEKIEALKKKIQSEVEDQKLKSAKSFKRIFTSFPTLTSKKNDKIRTILENTRTKIEEIKNTKKNK